MFYLVKTFLEIHQSVRANTQASMHIYMITANDLLVWELLQFAPPQILLQVYVDNEQVHFSHYE